MRGRVRAPAAAIISIPLLGFAAETLYASTDRGGALALVISVIAGASVGVLVWLAISGPPTSRRARAWSKAHLGAAGVTALGYTGLRAASFVYPSSNLLGGWALLFGPMLWLGMLALAVMVVPVLTTRLLSSNRS